MKARWAILLLAAFCFASAIPEWRHQNSGESRVVGSVRNRAWKTAGLSPIGKNFRYFSQASYYLFNNGYTGSKTCRTILEAYQTCETTCPQTAFRLMECSDRYGGRLLIHRTHQNGTSADFMVPKKRGTRAGAFFDHLDYFHYLISILMKKGGSIHSNRSKSTSRRWRVTSSPSTTRPGATV